MVAHGLSVAGSSLVNAAKNASILMANNEGGGVMLIQMVLLRMQTTMVKLTILLRIKHQMMAKLHLIILFH